METRSIPYSWGDIADLLSAVSANGTAPRALVKAEVFWDQVTLYLDDIADSEMVREWLAGLLPMRLQAETIVLDGPTFSQQLPFDIQQYDPDVAGEIPVGTAAQFVAASTQIWFHRRAADVAPTTRGFPSFAFHSVKGGVGRTTSAMSFALNLARQGKKPLLVDADFEAPGLSYLFLKDGRECHFSFEDLLVLAHADEDEMATATVKFGAEKLANQQHEGITFLPCLRRAEMLSAFAIRPEQLQSSRSTHPFFLLEVMQRLAIAAGCDSLIVDLRAGFTDLAAMVLCAPGVSPVFVTTPSGQAVHSTMEMLSFIGNETRKNSGPIGNPAIIINNVISQVKRSSEFARITSGLAESAQAFVADEEGSTDETAIISLSTLEVAGLSCCRFCGHEVKLA